MWNVVIEFKKQPVNGEWKTVLNCYDTEHVAQLIAGVINKTYPAACNAYVEKK